MSEPESYMIYTQKSAADKAINTIKGTAINCPDGHKSSPTMLHLIS